MSATEGGTRPQSVTLSAPVYGGFWRRAGAKVFDGLAAVIIAELFFFAWFDPLRHVLEPRNEDENVAKLMISVLLFWVAYNVGFLERFGATPGKLLFRLRVVSADGSPVSSKQAFARVFAEGLSYMTYFIGYIIAAFDREKRTLHDRICKTRVVRR